MIAKTVYGVNIAEFLGMCRKDGPVWLQWGRAELIARSRAEDAKSRRQSSGD